MSERAESIVEPVSKKVAPEENVRPKEQAPPPPYQDLEAGRPVTPTTLPARPIATNVMNRSLIIAGYCSLTVLCTAYGYTTIRNLPFGDGSSVFADALYSGVIGGTVLGIPFTRQGGIFNKYDSRWRLCNAYIARGRLWWTALEFLLCTFLTLLMCWGALVVGFCIQKAPIVFTQHPNMTPLLEHMAYDLYTSSTGVISLLSMMSMLAIWVLVKEPRISYNLEEDRFKLIVVGVLWTCFLTSVWGLVPLLHLLVVWVLPKKFTDRFVLESDKLRAADQASARDVTGIQ